MFQNNGASGIGRAARTSHGCGFALTSAGARSSNFSRSGAIVLGLLGTAIAIGFIWSDDDPINTTRAKLL